MLTRVRVRDEVCTDNNELVRVTKVVPIEQIAAFVRPRDHSWESPNSPASTQLGPQKLIVDHVGLRG